MPIEDRRKATTRLSGLQVVIAALFSVLAVSFWTLQVVQHAKFEELAENNHQRTLALRAPRGLVFDRDGRVMVENRHSYSISIVREHTKDLDRTVRMLAAVVGLDEAGVRTHRRPPPREPTYRPITIVQDASLAQVAAVTARRLDFELPDVVVEQVPTRRYPDTMGAHLFGYVGEVSDAQVADNSSLKSGDITGQSGLEKIYNGLLVGEDGARRVVVNSVGREIRTLEEDPPTEGKRLQLTVDFDVQKAIEDGFDAIGLNGAAVVLDPSRRRRARLHQPSGVRSERVRLRHRPRDVGRAQHRPRSPAQRSRHSGPLLARIDVQDGRGARGARRRHHHARLPRELPRPRQLLRPRFQVLALQQGRARFDRHASRDSSSRATSTSTRSRTWSASTRSTSGRRRSAWVC